MLTKIPKIPILFAVTTFSCTPAHDENTVEQAQLSGAIFTTTVDGTVVDENVHYATKADVYITGGPNNANANSVLPDGTYYFQVTDPGCMTLLSTDEISCRQFTVADGVITGVVDIGGCEHNIGTDPDNVPVQLVPYNDSPNHGDEYKVWATPIADYDTSGSSQGGLCNGFFPADSKTDNFKVRLAPYCGDGTVDIGEQCDDGNNVDGDGCSADCKIETPPPACGDGNLDAGEECDDGNTTNGDGCSSTCTIETPPPPVCGDGHLDAGEECDDGNTTSGDGCSADCKKEKAPCPVCGNGIVESGEQCDDGNTTNGDGCSSTCQTEPACPPT